MKRAKAASVAEFRVFAAYRMSSSSELPAPMSQTRLTLRRSFRESPEYVRIRMKRLRTGHARVPQQLLRSSDAHAFGDGFRRSVANAQVEWGNTTVKPDELARCVLRLAMEGERDPVRLQDGALKGLIPATGWREAG